MNTAIKKCRVCGKEYEACRSARRGDGVFRWREVACSPEHGEIYLAQILASRAKTSQGNEAQAPADTQAAPVGHPEAQPAAAPKRGRKKKTQTTEENK